MLTQEQLGFFARNGYLHIANHVDAATCTRLVDHTWTRLPPAWDRTDPSSWTAPVGDSCHVSDLDTRLGLLKFQKGDLIRNPVIEGVFGARATGGRLARDLIGCADVAMRVRGLYSIFPLQPEIGRDRAVRPHVEAHPAQLIALHYLEDVVPGGGGLNVWPGSHREIYPVMRARLEHVATPEFDAVYAAWCAREPREIWGKRGDMVIIHHRLLHAPGLNRSRNIRYGFLCDYQAADFQRFAAKAPGRDLWQDWPAIAALPAALRDAPCDFVLGRRRGRVDARPQHAGASKLSVKHAMTADPSNVRKGDASIIARSRQDGDIWLQISDSAEIAGDREIYPRGSELGRGAPWVTVDGVPCESMCRFDFVARLEPGDGPRTITVRGGGRPLWLKVIRVRLPFVKTEILAQARIDTPNAAVTYGTDPVAEDRPGRAPNRRRQPVPPAVAVPAERHHPDGVPTG